MINFVWEIKIVARSKVSTDRKRKKRKQTSVTIFMHTPHPFTVVLNIHINISFREVSLSTDGQLLAFDVSSLKLQTGFNYKIPNIVKWGRGENK